MCESHTIFHLCGHVNIKTIVQCADIIDKLLVSGTSIASNHQVCQDDVSDNVHVFPGICTRCMATGVIGDVMDVPGVKLEVMKAWESQRKRMSATGSNKNIDTVDTGDGEADKIRECETLERISLPDNVSTSAVDRAGAFSSSTPATSSVSSSTCREPSPASTPDLSQIKARVMALRARAERLVMKIRAHNLPKLG
ncbi:hypothetical protein G647_01194 [Cladophialophora carrionii CBS 160.54]|uniref:Uncharacterized protein n=1 Tax=Cladophialophora carrionii CBS 160.54 TaxID=1279043 RepID=V9DQZ7_9EURO|nr:uncharacterized protein G647_01194 [Cladophialophora carrionii CBS 160.54]ETI28743.1 hypothetical protein G647_01194 [Cladophialophora carrionii CBS 160.54]